MKNLLLVSSRGISRAMLSTHEAIQKTRGAAVVDGATLLQRELSKRIAKNPKYSLRAFAKALNMSPGNLSLILSRKIPLTRKSLDKVSQVMEVTPLQRQHLEDRLAKLRTRRNEAIREDRHQYVSMDIFTMLSEWHHYAILSLLELKDSKLNPKWISAKLGITEFQSQEAIERLQRLELISKVDGKWRQSAAPFRVESHIASPAARSFQKQLLLKAIEALENTPADTRDMTAMTFAMSKQDMEYASTRITEFRRSLTEELEARSSPDGVYNLMIQLFPLSKD